MKTLFALLAIASPFAVAAHATDRLVDASGVASPLTTITQAMVIAAPGDRIFVMPGTYPAFHFSRGVEVVGLGTDPSDVVIARVDFHPTIPTNNFDAGLTNVTICSADPADSTSIGGNELAAGTLVLQGVVTCGGVYLHGAGQLYLMVVDSRIVPAPGTGFLGAAFDFGGGIADFVDSWVAGADASTAQSFTAGTGLRVGGGATVRVSNTHVFGGAGANTGVVALQNAADAIEKGFGAALPTLRLSGHSVIAGGDAGPLGVGGAGVDMVANISIGMATVTGGSGTPTGLAYTSGAPLVLARDPYLVMTPPKSFGLGDVFFRPGQQILVMPGDVLPGVTLADAYRIDPPANASLSPLPSLEAMPVAGAQFSLLATGSTLTRSGNVTFYPRRRIYLQAFYQEEGGAIESTNPVALMVAPN